MEKKNQEITDYMMLTYKLMQWANKKPQKRGILVVTYDEERNLSGAVPFGDLINLSSAIENEMENNDDFRLIIESAVKFYNENKK